MTRRHIERGKYVRERGEGGVGGSDKAAPPCFCASLLSKVISGAVNFERLTNICRTMYKRSIYLSQKNFFKIRIHFFYLLAKNTFFYLLFCLR